jgi:V/A-type H+-transporting ATPase subunit I
MLRPERMSRVSVAGAKPVMDDAVEALHEHGRLHLSDYGGDWAGFDPGSPVAGADEASEKLVTVRSLESILDVDADDAGPTRIVTDEALEEELESVRTEVNELDDRRDAIEEDLREVEDRLSAVEPFAELGIDLDLLSGYDSLQVAVGRGNRSAVVETLETDEAVGEFGVLPEDDDADVLAVFARPTGDADAGVLSDALVGVRFEELSVPAVDDLVDAVDDEEFGDTPGAVTPESYVEALEHRREELQTRLDAVETELEELKLEAAGFLLAAEERLTIDVQKREAPLSFATTDHSFVAEGWVPAEEYEDLAAAVRSATDERVEVEELERVDHEEYARRHAHEEEDHDEEPAGEGPTPDATGGEEAVAADGSGDDDAARADGGTARADGGTAVDASGAVTMGGEPPVELDNGPASNPFELLVEAVELPRYDEFDPTMLLFLTFPAFFGYMIGDAGYGLLYGAIGYALYTRTESPSFQALGGIAMWAGGFTALFGVLYGEFFGLHFLGELYGGAVIHKGLMPYYADYATAWFLVTVLAGVVHLTMGYALAFVQDAETHGLGEAVMEDGSWLLMLFGLWGWVFSKHLAGSKPGFLVGPGSTFDGAPFPLAFTGFPVEVGYVGLAMFVVGLVMILKADLVEGIEALFLQVFVNGLSYTRMAAVLLAKAGMAFVVNLLVFGAYQDPDGVFHFLFFSETTAQYARTHAGYDLLFPGMVAGQSLGDPVGLVLGWFGGILVLVAGHLAVLGLGVTSAGLQAVRLEYVEFFSKFYEGGGKEYEPFGYDRQFTTED